MDERLAAESVIDYFSCCDIFADKGFIGFKWQTSIFDQMNNLIWTPKRSNQQVQNSKNLDRWLSKVRERIEGVSHEIQNTGRNLERLLAKTVWGLRTRVVAKMTSHLLRRIPFRFRNQSANLSNKLLISHQTYYITLRTK